MNENINWRPYQNYEKSTHERERDKNNIFIIKHRYFYSILYLSLDWYSSCLLLVLQANHWKVFFRPCSLTASTSIRDHLLFSVKTVSLNQIKVLPLVYSTFSLKMQQKPYSKKPKATFSYWNLMKSRWISCDTASIFFVENKIKMIRSNLIKGRTTEKDSMKYLD